MDRDTNWIPDGADLDTPSAARVYDALLGGAHNFEVDREFAAKAKQVFPGVDVACRANRSFLRRAVVHGLDAGVRQFLDIGSGIPTVGNVHEIAQEVDPGARVLYVDNEAVAVEHSKLILDSNEHASIIRADMCQPEQLLEQASDLLDFSEPIMLLMLALVHFIPDSAGPAELVAQYRQALPDGSYLAITHATGDARPDDMRKLEALYATSSNPAVARSRAWITGLFDGYELVAPGAVFVPEWRPDNETLDNPENYIFFGGLGRKRDS
ncbi:SAM-dependent methyltransferase [Saccharopolyspora sp. K220]|uniref:SAM-dependent methyltransferase n=1 Tax=Saccharopolyspora soli TaxID=2926618 RepID=UPI001F5A01CB|nr:SAM-dependent methyltransferase [Saccharopolyspora soli]MCI2415990.1 SAM-dependent methyltransferase [Saccharopolyspora soli]